MMEQVKRIVWNYSIIDVIDLYFKYKNLSDKRKVKWLFTIKLVLSIFWRKYRTTHDW
jgi:hypothetical protein